MEEKAIESICKEIDELVRKYGYSYVKSIELVIKDMEMDKVTKHKRIAKYS